MSTVELTLNRAVASLVDFIKENVKRNLYSALAADMIDVNKEELDKICRLIESSVEEGHQKGYTEIEFALKEIANR
jgi:hypothetical protein|tara:strand:- start:123 stop:350 length:228 start_codon:yes stop_codon:yes gene_type:complete